MCIYNTPYVRSCSWHVLTRTFRWDGNDRYKYQFRGGDMCGSRILLHVISKAGLKLENKLFYSVSFPGTHCFLWSSCVLVLKVQHWQKVLSSPAYSSLTNRCPCHFLHMPKNAKERLLGSLVARHSTQAPFIPVFGDLIRSSHLYLQVCMHQDPSDHILRGSGLHMATFFPQYVRKCLVGHTEGPPTQIRMALSRAHTSVPR